MVSEIYAFELVAATYTCYEENTSKISALTKRDVF